jgi:hypothetical protein
MEGYRLFVVQERDVVLKIVGRERAIHAPMFAIMNALFGKNGWT